MLEIYNKNLVEKLNDKIANSVICSVVIEGAQLQGNGRRAPSAWGFFNLKKLWKQ